MAVGSLTIVGLGIQAAEHVSVGALTVIRECDKVFHWVADPIATAWLEDLHPSAESLNPFVVEGKSRVEAYDAIVEHVLAEVRRPARVCVAVYGNPSFGVDVTSSFRTRGRAEGFPVVVLPAVSSLDCLFVDLGVDPFKRGIQLFEANEYLADPRGDVRTDLVLFQVGLLGTRKFGFSGTSMATLATLLTRAYGDEHEVVLYEASWFPERAPRVERLRVDELVAAKTLTVTTLYVPAKRAR
jgi:uncharacterized protein YabN with tetrapyrrole methylase and pyrophosphatase domain